MRQPGREGRAGGGDEHRLDRPVFAGPEYLDLSFPLTDQAQGDGLDPARRTAARQLPPQDRRQRETHEVIERAARHVGFDQRQIEVTRMLDRVPDRAAGDFVEGNPLHLDAAQGLLVLQHRADVPGNRLALSIRVGGEIEGLGALQRLGDRADLLFAPGIGLPVHGEVLVRTNAAVLRGEIANMAETGQNGVPAAQVSVDGFRLGGGFNDNYVRHEVLG